MVYKGFYNLGPATLNNLFVLYTPERTLRSGDELRITPQLCYTAFGQRYIVYRGTQYSNSLPVSLKACQSMDSFKRTIKEYPGFD